MNTVDFLKYSKFPASAETFDFMQSMITLLAQFASLGGENYILAGCSHIGSTYGPGIVVVNGEIMPFEGGTAQTYVIIEETTQGVTVGTTNYNGLYTTRVLKFGTGTGQMAWSGFRQIATIAELVSDIAAKADASALAAKADANHGHEIADVSGLSDALGDKLDASAINASMGLKLLFAGVVTAGATPTITKQAGSLTGLTVEQSYTGTYRINHGFTGGLFFVTAIGLAPDANRTNISPRTIYKGNGYFLVNTSDDATSNDCNFEFQMWQISGF